MNPRTFDRRFVIVSGKGGVGKSTVSAAIALAAARFGLRTCVLQLNSREAIAHYFDVPPVGFEPARLCDDLPLYAANLRPEDALREYGLMKLRFRALYRLVFENEVMRRLLRMVPGLNETVLLGKAWYMENELYDAEGNPEWDLLVVDAPATGHGVSLLRLPETILGAVPVGPMAEDARQMRALLLDPRRTSFNVVTLPQELPVNEALELAEEARRSVGVPGGFVIANCVLAESLADVTPAFLGSVAAGLGGLDAVAAASLDAAARWQRTRSDQQVQLARLRASSPLPVVELPMLFARPDRAGLETLSAVLAGHMGPPVRRAGARVPA